MYLFKIYVSWNLIRLIPPFCLSPPIVTHCIFHRLDWQDEKKMETDGKSQNPNRVAVAKLSSSIICWELGSIAS
jgi:hypothetical protein